MPEQAGHLHQPGQANRSYNMKCEEIQPLLVARQCGELDAFDAPELDTHLRACESCQREARELAETWNEVQSAPSLSAPQEALRALRTAAADLVDRDALGGGGLGWLRARWTRLALAGAAACALTIAAALHFGLWQPWRSDVAAPPVAKTETELFWDQAQNLEEEIQTARFDASLDMASADNRIQWMTDELARAIESADK